MQYAVVPFAPVVRQQDGAAGAANQLADLANRMTAEGWRYVRLETVRTVVAGSAGCMGCFASPATQADFYMVVFERG
jgi:hypothetical protein